MAKKNTYFEDERTYDKFKAGNIKKVLRYIIPYKKIFVLGCAIMIVQVLMSVLPTLCNKVIIDDYIGSSGDLAVLLKAVGAWIFISISNVILEYIRNIKTNNMGFRIIADIRKDIFDKLQKLSLDFFDSIPTGKILVRVTNYISDLANMFTNYLMILIVEIVRMIIVVIVMYIVDYRLATVALCAVVPMGAFVIIMRQILAKRLRNSRNKSSNRTAFIHESIMGNDVTQSFNRSNTNMGIFKSLNGDVKSAWLRVVNVNELYFPGTQSIWYIGNCVIYFVSLYLMQGSNPITYGVVATFISYMALFNTPINMIAEILRNLAEASSNLEKVFETIETEPKIDDKADAKELVVSEGAVRYKDVTFAYEEGVNVLEHFSLDVRPGQTIALVGPTGAGKSTIVNLLCRFYDVTEGEVTIDGQDVRDVTLHSLRSSIGIMPQDTFIFSGTIIDNIRYGKPDATDEECMMAAKVVQADDFIREQPNGYYTKTLENGEGLSAGQKQLIAFARVVLKNPRILILDEATANIDTDTEKKIQMAIATLMKDRTTLVVAHRLSTIKNADNILCIANKGILEQGTHKELMAKKGMYYSLVKQL